MKKELFLAIAKDLNENLTEYLHYSWIARKHKCHWRTAKSYCEIIINTLQTLDIQHLDMLYEEKQLEKELKND